MNNENLEGPLREEFEREYAALVQRYETARSTPRIAIQGIAGSFSDEAASKRFSSFEIVECDSFTRAFDAVEKGIADFGLIPVENSIHGPVVETYDLLAQRSLFVIEEMKMRIVHCLIGSQGHVYSHPQALGQCREYLERHRLTSVPYYDTAGAVKEKASSALAIGSERAARIYDARIVERDIGPAQNTTRFFLVSRTRGSGSDRGAAIFTLRASHEAGTLAHALANLESFGVNLTKIESRPAGNFTYRFIIEYEWSDDVEPALRSLEEHCASIKDLGRFSITSIE